MHYRSDIDGLRAIAVLSVLFFHAQFPLFSGGFVGVDIFFVISGFLITSIVINDLKKGDFSFQKFYHRRVRRLLPALLFVLFLTAFIAFLILTPKHFERFGGALLTALISSSNIFFWTEAGYWDAESIFKPLLHTWSLSVEGQFYAIWPFFLFLFYAKGRSLPIIITLLGVVSLLANLTFEEDKEAIFYLMPFRVFEFAMGALLVWVVHKQPANIIKEILLAMGLVMIAISVLTYEQNMVFPSFPALLPCMGAMLVIYAGQARYVGMVLRTPLMVFTGKISYSLYLVHWPILILYSYWKFENVGDFETQILLGCSFLLAVFMYYFIEQPSRKKRSGTYLLNTHQFMMIIGAVMFILLIFGWLSWDRKLNGTRVRMNPVSENYQSTLDLPRCENGYGICPKEKREPDFYLWGDSHANGVYLFATIAAKNKQLVHAERGVPGCKAMYDSGKDCEKRMNTWLDGLIEKKAKAVFLVSAWNHKTQTTPPELMLKQTGLTVKKLTEAGVTVYVWGSVPLLKRSPSTCFNRPINHQCESWMELPFEQEQPQYNKKFRDIVVQNGGRYFDIFAELCKDGKCRGAYEGRSLYGDKVHMSQINFGGLMHHKYGENVTFDDLFKR